MVSKLSEYSICSPDQLIELWEQTYNESGKPDWSILLPYYADEIHFVDPVQEIHGIEEFRAMVERLAGRTNEAHMKVLRVSMNEHVAFVEWVLTINFRNTKRVPMYGLSRIILNDEGKIVEQHDLYDLWGTILTNIPFLDKLYRFFMKRVFG